MAEAFSIIDGSNRYAVLNVLGRNEYIRLHHSHGNNINGKAKYFRVLIRQRENY